MTAAKGGDCDGAGAHRFEDPGTLRGRRKAGAIEKDIEDTRNLLTADEQFLAELKDKCSTTDKERGKESEHTPVGD